MKRFGRLLIAFFLANGVLFATAQSGLAACHAFAISVDPSTVTEGGTVTVTVSRDAAFNPSSVQVTAQDESATSPADYEDADRRIEFTTETSRTFPLATKDDADSEGTETFLLRTSNGAGCQVNQRFTYGEARLTIQDNDSAGATTGGSQPASGRTTSGRSPSPTVSPTASPSPSPEETIEALELLSPTPDSSPTPLRTVAQEDSGGGSTGLIVAAVAFLVAGGAGAGWWLLRRRAT